jgi:predicted MFS family arabinose efflux permease
VVKTSEAASAHASRSRIWPLVLAYGLFGFGYVITATFLGAMVRNSPGVQAFEPWIWIVVGLAAIPSVSLWSSLGHRIGILNALAAACFAEALGVAASVLWVNVWGLFLAAALLGGTFMGITALGLIAARRMSASPLRSLSLMTAAFGVGQIVGPTAAGFGYQLTGSLYLPSLIAALALCVAALLSFVSR